MPTMHGFTLKSMRWLRTWVCVDTLNNYGSWVLVWSGTLLDLMVAVLDDRYNLRLEFTKGNCHAYVHAHMCDNELWPTDSGSNQSFDDAMRFVWE